MRKKIIAGNWKMNCNLIETKTLVQEILQKVENLIYEDKEVVLVPPFIHASTVSEKTLSASNVFVGVQNCSEYEKGAYTGEISASMLIEHHINYVILGHSERRSLYGETNEIIAKKVNMALKYGIKPIFCCGETLEEREKKIHFSIIKKQIAEGLFHLNKSSLLNIVIAYEPVWAIGTGETAAPAQAQEIHAFIRQLLANQYDEETANSISILYGGSVKPNNALELFSLPDVDGGLVGGASLLAMDFVEIIKSI